ncbi:LytTR family DNA-binding domain-containing protein [Balneolales bacterium ANBcel1]|nr:LytTR family DNA-binding domain-containing protein [Balneolales bacterium ANBcel1]
MEESAMARRKMYWYQRYFPQNYIIREPRKGVPLMALFVFVFVLTYSPRNVHASMYLGVEFTVLIYSLVCAVIAYGAIRLLRHHRSFSASSDWNIVKEIAAIAIVLSSMAIGVYFLAFLLEEPANRWNFPTFINSFTSTVLLGSIPFFLFSLIHLNRLLPGKSMAFGNETMPGASGEPEADSEPADPPIHIHTPLKKDELALTISEFLYAVSEGNYVIFYYDRRQNEANGDDSGSGKGGRSVRTGSTTPVAHEGDPAAGRYPKAGQYRETKAGAEKTMVRIPIAKVEEQLADHPCLMRTHRAYIVNLKKVTNVSGNMTGLRLTLSGAGIEIPVSRSYTKQFRERFRQFGTGV